MTRSFHRNGAVALKVFDQCGRQFDFERNCLLQCGEQPRCLLGMVKHGSLRRRESSNCSVGRNWRGNRPVALASSTPMGGAGFPKSRVHPAIRDEEWAL